MKKIALLDVDGVVADFCGSLFRCMGTDHTVSSVKSWGGLFEIFTPAETHQAIDVLRDGLFWRDEMSVYPMAPSFVDNLRSKYEVVFVTTPWPECQSWCWARGAWLTANFGVHKKVYTQHKELVSGDIFIDDNPATVELWQQHHSAGRGYVFDQPFNRTSAASLVRVSHDWEIL